MPWSCVGFYVVVYLGFIRRVTRCKVHPFCCGKPFHANSVQSCCWSCCKEMWCGSTLVLSTKAFRRIFGLKLSVSRQRSFPVTPITLEQCKYPDLLSEFLQVQWLLKTHAGGPQAAQCWPGCASAPRGSLRGVGGEGRAAEQEAEFCKYSLCSDHCC